MSTYVLKLYIAGKSPRLESSIDGLRRTLDFEFKKDYELHIYDVIEHPQVAEDAKILATPTLVREHPLPVRRIIGDLSDTDKIFFGLDLHNKARKGER